MRNLQESYREQDPNKIEKRSELFLKKIIGEEKLYKLKKDGKIEIEVDNESNGKTTYELYSDGRVTNKTKNESYCIVADRSDYPTNDMVAIKYAWLVHKNSTAERVANKTSLRNGNLLGGHYGYDEYIDYLGGRGWSRNTTTLDENNTEIVYTRSAHKGITSTIVDVICPPGMKMTMMGRQQVPRGADITMAHSISLYITDENGKEIPDNTKIRITKDRPSDFVIQLARVFYGDIKKTEDERMSYSFVNGIELNGEDHIMIFAVNPECDISQENIKFEMEADLWRAN